MDNYKLQILITKLNKVINYKLQTTNNKLHIFCVFLMFVSQLTNAYIEVTNYYNYQLPIKT
jgi:hypothetical protein